METRVHEIAADDFRLSTFVPDVTPEGFTFNQFLIRAEEPMLFHCGQRMLFPSIAEAVGRVLPVDQLRWIGFGHVEADECGAMNAWLAAAPRANVVHGALACDVSLNDVGDPPAPPPGGRRGPGPRRKADALARYAPCPPRLGSRFLLRGS